MKATLAGIISLAGAVSAQQSLYGQCGGVGWTGQTSCVSGACCKYQNDYYSQCLSGSCVASSTTKATSTSTSRSTLTTSTTTAKTTTTTSKASSSSSKTTSTSAPASTGYPHADGTLFNIDGVTKYYAGTNSYWIGFLTNDADVDLVMSQLQQSGLKILRVWGFNDVNTVPSSGTVYYQLLSASGSTINTGADGLQRLDKVVASAEAHDIKLIINFVNNWNDYGGINAYNVAFGGNHTTWFTDATSQAQYKKYIQAVVSRYKTSTAVLAWELANEPRCNGCSTDVIYNWATTISAYIKSLDSNHMVTLGDEGFGMSTGDGSYPYTYGEGVDWIKNLGISTLDFGTFHLYPSSWGTTNDWGNAWIQNHGAECVKQNKPCLFEEYGVTSDHCSVESPWQTTALATPGIAADLFWQLGTVLSSGQTSDDGNTIYYNTSGTCNFPIRSKRRY